MGFKPVNTAGLKEKISQLEKDSKERSFAEGGRSYLKLPLERSKTWVRFLPPVGTMADTDTGKLVFTHFQIPSKEMSVIKCYKTYGLPCQMCDLLAKYEKRFEVDNWKSALSTEFNVMLRRQQIADSKGNMVEQAIENPGSPTVLQMSGDYNLIWLDKEIDEGGNLLDPFAGNDVLFERVQYKGKFERRVIRDQTAVAATEDLINQIADKAIDFNKYYKPPDENYAKKMELCCAAVQKTIEEKLMPLEGQNTQQMNQDNYGQGVHQAAPETAAAPAPIPAPAPAPIPQAATAAPVNPAAPPQPIPAPAPIQQAATLAPTPAPAPIPAPAPQVIDVQATQVAPQNPPVVAAPETAATPGFNHPAQPNVAPAPIPQVATVPLPAGVTAPPNAPACFGQVGTFYAVDQKQKDKCQVCHVEFDCRSSINVSNPGHIEAMEIPF